MKDVVTDPLVWLLAVLAIGVFPGALLRLLVLAYPKRHPRRRELVAELRAVKPVDRPLWTIGHIETVLQEAPAARRAAQATRPARRESFGFIKVSATRSGTRWVEERSSSNGFEVRFHNDLEFSAVLSGRRARQITRAVCGKIQSGTRKPRLVWTVSGRDGERSAFRLDDFSLSDERGNELLWVFELDAFERRMLAAVRSRSHKSAGCSRCRSMGANGGS